MRLTGRKPDTRSKRCPCCRKWREIGLKEVRRFRDRYSVQS